MNIQNNFKDSLEFKGRILEVEGKHVWGTSVVQSDDGKFHAYYSCWDHTDPHETWVISCKVMHAVADKVEGPYTVVGDALVGKDDGSWDSWTIHNPSVIRDGSKYVMVYMGNNGNFTKKTQKEASQGILKVEETHQFGNNPKVWNKGPVDPKEAEEYWKIYVGLVGQKRVGMAIADNPNGPWIRVGNKPILEVGPKGSWDDFVTSNPALIKGTDGEYKLYYKAWSDETNKHGGNRKYGLATSKTLTGPYIKYEGNPIVDFSAKDAQLEDVSMFIIDKTYYMVSRDMGVQDNLRGMIMKSPDGIHFNKPVTAYGPVPEYSDEPVWGLLPREGNYERPQIVIVDNKPYAMVVAARGGKWKTSSSAVFKINYDKLTK